jgi:hypothetical protein
MMELLEVMNDIKLRCILRHCRIRNLRAVLVAHWPTAKGFLIHAPLSSQNAQNSRNRNDYGSFGNGFSIARTDRNRRVNPLVFTHLFVSPPNPEHQPHYQLPTMTTLHTSASAAPCVPDAEEAFAELIKIYHAENANPALRSPLPKDYQGNK